MRFQYPNADIVHFVNSIRFYNSVSIFAEGSFWYFDFLRSVTAGGPYVPECTCCLVIRSTSVYLYCFASIKYRLLQQFCWFITSSDLTWTCFNIIRASHFDILLNSIWLSITDEWEKRKRSDSVIWQKPLHQQKCQKGKLTTQTTPQKSSITERLRTDLGRPVGVTLATKLVWLTWFTGPTFPLPATAV